MVKYKNEWLRGFKATNLIGALSGLGVDQSRVIRD